MRRGRAPARRRWDAPRGHRILPLPQVVRRDRATARTGRRFRRRPRAVPRALRPEADRARPRRRADQPSARDAPQAGRNPHRRARIRHTALGCDARTRTHPLRRDTRRSDPHRNVYAHVLPRRNLGITRILKTIIHEKAFHPFVRLQTFIITMILLAKLLNL